MKSRNIRYIPELDHLRFLAALLVFGFHFFHYNVGQWTSYPDKPFLGLIIEGHTGVSLFFVLSGFIFMTIALENEGIDYASFLRNRLLRIAPLFLTIFVVAVSIGRDRFEATDLFYLFVTNIGDAPTSWHFSTGPAWSISVEFLFYLAFPFLAASAKEQGPSYLLKAIALLLVVKLGAYLATDNSRHMLYSTLVGRFDQFLIGMLAAIFYRRKKAMLERFGKHVFLFAALLVFLGAAVQARWLSFLSLEPKQPLGVVWGSLEASIWAGFVVAYLAAQFRFPRLVAFGLMRGGEWSFSLYMWHAMIIFIANQMFGMIGGTGAWAIATNALFVLGIAIIFSGVSYAVIEKPFLEMRKKYSK